MNALSLPALPLTLTVSFCLLITFFVFFLRENSRRFSHTTRKSPLPLADEVPRVAGIAEPAAPHDHDHDHGECGCRSGRRVPCPGCLKRPPARS